MQAKIGGSREQPIKLETAAELIDLVSSHLDGTAGAVVVFASPTGGGKSTLMHSVIREINQAIEYISDEAHEVSPKGLPVGSVYRTAINGNQIVPMTPIKMLAIDELRSPEAVTSALLMSADQGKKVLATLYAEDIDSAERRIDTYSKWGGCEATMQKLTANSSILIVSIERYN